MAKGTKRYTPEELTLRAERLRRLNESGRAGARFARLGGRPRKGETREEALARRRKAFQEASELAGKPKPPVVVVQARPCQTAKADAQEQIERVFRKHSPAKRYGSDGWRYP